MKHRGNGESMEPLIRWHGWSKEHDTWEAINNVQEGSSEILKGYLRQSGLCKSMYAVIAHQIVEEKLYYRVEWEEESGNIMETLEKEEDVAKELSFSYWRGDS
jgi:hypothetical protein